MNTTALIRPAWTPATIALMVLGFVVFWPLGLAMLAYILWGDRLDGFKRDVKGATDGFFASAAAAMPAITASAAPATSPSTSGARRSSSGSPKSAASSTRR